MFMSAKLFENEGSLPEQKAANIILCVKKQVYCEIAPMKCVILICSLLPISMPNMC